MKKNNQKNTSSKTDDMIYVYIGLGVIAVLAALFFLFKSSPVSTNPADILQPSADDWVKGKSQTENTLIEYSDFQCPACAYYKPVLSRISDKYPDNLKIIYRHFPLKRIHPKAQFAAQAAEAAGRQGKFWEMYDKLFDNQKQWAEAKNEKKFFESYAKDIGLDIKKFQKDYKSSQAQKKISKNLAEAHALNLKATPSFFFNGESVAQDNLRNLFVFIDSKMSIIDKNGVQNKANSSLEDNGTVKVLEP